MGIASITCLAVAGALIGVIADDEYQLLIGLVAVALAIAGGLL